ncbi:helix-turn-helix domain-containing protein [Pimelobacter simplex]|nr:helix-turn-helix domain-containing protein [Pimelobacter simplex]
MLLKDRKQLAKLMVIQGVSARQLARAAGWRSHSYMNRLLAGDVRTLSTDPALRIAHYLGVGVDDLFLVKVSNDDVSTPHRKAS